MVNIDELNSRIRRRMAKSRRNNSLTQFELSLKIEHNDKHISLIENETANHSLPTLAEIANALGELLEYFISEEKRILRTLCYSEQKITGFHCRHVQFYNENHRIAKNKQK